MTGTKPTLIIISAPSGTGKSTIISRIIDRPELNLSFSVSATNRQPRTGEREGVDYYFLSDERFRQLREEDGFIECVEVYPGRFYGTLRSELTRIAQIGKNLLLDIDVEGAIRIKEQFGEAALAIFVQPPSLEVLRQRLTNRATDSAESIEHRLSRAAYELSLASHFDITIVNDQLEKAVDEVAEAIHRFIPKA